MTEKENEIWEHIQKQKQRELRAKVFAIMANILIIFTLGLFIVSPLVQLIIRLAMPDKYHHMLLTSTSIQVVKYQQMIRRVNQMTRFVAAFLYIYAGYYIVRNRKTIKKDLGKYLKKLAPLFLFFLLAADIVIVTKLRGANEYDLTGHPYMYESIFSYITYPVVYFFCGVMLYSERLRKALIYTLLFSSFPLNVLELVNVWVTPVKYFVGNNNACAVFHNSNHYGYYLALTVISGALLYAYEKNLFLKISAAVCAAIATIVLIINNTLGAYLAVLFVIMLFVIYCFFIVRREKKEAVIIWVGFMLITVIMSFFYNTVLSSYLTLINDLGLIIADPLEADSAGSHRWALWKGTVQHMGESPWLGFGVEGLLNTYGVGTPHNEFLQYAEFFGIPASLLYITACSMVLLRVFKKCRVLDKTSMICFFISLGYLASSFFGVAIYYTTPFIYIFLGMSYAQYLREDNLSVPDN